ncbi:hypothetical protein MKZ38_000809 [Zalerion maritima]|uniref:Uncharacterized protein n=1 Tax=Zalerion maritima TaxID=339359 RepID=A0AAD5WTP5_9PEZI|nr:hypothetical protein MKZ38_000809 [Zalerion maritima]
MPLPPLLLTSRERIPPPGAVVVRPPRPLWRRALTAQTQTVEYTPANSIYEQDVGSSIGRPRLSIRIFQRAFNGCFHVAVAALLLSVMAEYVMESGPKGPSFLVGRDGTLIDVDPETLDPVPIEKRDTQCRSLAIAIMILTSADILIDVIFTFFIWIPWTSFALLPRLFLGIGYLAVFMAHVGLQKVFPPGYSYWGLKSDFAGPVVYLFLWALGVWDMLHVCIHRHQLGKDSRRLRDSYRHWRARSDSRPSMGPNTPALTAAGARDGATSSGVAMSQVTQVDIEGGLEQNDSNSISLQERPNAEDERKSIGTSSVIETPPSTADTVTATSSPHDEIQEVRPSSRRG